MITSTPPIAEAPKRGRGRPRKIMDRALMGALQELKGVMDSRRAAPGWTLTQDEVAFAADILSHYGRVYPRLVWQATGGSMQTVSSLLDEWWRELIRTHPARRPSLDAPNPQALALREKLTRIEGVMADAPSGVDPRAWLANADQLQRNQQFQGQLDQLQKDNGKLLEENRQLRTEYLEIKREFAAALGTVFREVREPMNELRRITREMGALVPPLKEARTAREKRSASRPEKRPKRRPARSRATRRRAHQKPPVSGKVDRRRSAVRKRPI